MAEPGYCRRTITITIIHISIENEARAGDLHMFPAL